ncbi:hypothetical protein FA13DRAFT_1731999 [Coprinellus micaceus]|uniref:Uncharacterized protein n=1 Tax=Coprinellus micaceus TaxID=71717 RepID=A0A4Y7TE61_COPMI|nr:hypothetical protein FA13DRAFT_1731999 [Coprinellus micaceus]
MLALTFVAPYSPLGFCAKVVLGTPSIFKPANSKHTAPLAQDVFEPGVCQLPDSRYAHSAPLEAWNYLLLSSTSFVANTSAFGSQEHEPSVHFKTSAHSKTGPKYQLS